MAKKSDKEEEKNIFQKVGDGIKTAWQIFFISATVLSIALAADSIYKLTQQPITLETLGPALGNLLPVAALGYAGAARLVALAVRLFRVLLSIPIVLGGTYYLAPSLPEFFAKSPDLASTSVFALLATPEVLEALVVLSILVTFAVWVGTNFVGAVGGLSETFNKNKQQDRY